MPVFALRRQTGCKALSISRLTLPWALQALALEAPLAPEEACLPLLSFPSQHGLNLPLSSGPYPNHPPTGRPLSSL